MDKDIGIHDDIKEYSEIPPISEIFNWCVDKQTILALQNGNILTTDKNSSDLNNCKNLMESHGVVAREVVELDQNMLKELCDYYINNHPILRNNKKTTQSRQQAILYNLIKQAYNEKISDIHMEVRSDKTTVRVRRFGELEFLMAFPTQLGIEIVAVAFNSEASQSVEGFNPTKFQNTALEFSYNSQRINVRISTMPCVEGFDMIMRLLNNSAVEWNSLENLGYQKSQVHLIKRAIQRPHGSIIISGPTGSGKSTTVAACLAEIPEYRKIYTVEDPVEYHMEQASQVSVNTDEKSTSYARVSRALLRMDPDVIVIGEIRDIDVANTMLQAANTGHLVFTTLHTKGAINVISRLLDMGVSEKTLSESSVLLCIISQRLIPKLCPICAVPLNENLEQYKAYLPDWNQIFGDKIKHVKTRNMKGLCSHCEGRGIIGRTAVAEVLWIDEEAREFIKHCNILQWSKHLAEKKWQTCLHHAALLVNKGVCDPLDVEKHVGSLIEINKFEDPDLAT